MANEVGRPRKYSNVEELQYMIDEYFECCNQNHRPYTITGLALWLDMDRKGLLRYEKDYEDEFCHTIKRAKERVQEYVECCLFKKGITAGVIFNLKNNFGWEDAEVVEHKGAQPIIDVSKLTDEQIQEMLNKYDKTE
ncbi:MAG: hypothetical protein IJO32_00580 [Bacilli bacterium]|nr:hypothetical protein [Bacilli bacterium]